MRFAAIFLIFFISSCSSTGIVKVDGDKYMVAKRSAQIGFGPPVGVKADIYREANAFCESQGKEVETVEIEMTNSGFGRPASASLTFRCKEKTEK